VAIPVTSDERYKGARGRGKGCDCYGRGRDSPWLDNVESDFKKKGLRIKFELFPGSLLCYNIIYH
jgi:hypothetical protein